jgi:hypothetical protein
MAFVEETRAGAFRLHVSHLDVVGLVYEFHMFVWVFIDFFRIKSLGQAHCLFSLR